MSKETRVIARDAEQKEKKNSIACKICATRARLWERLWLPMKRIDHSGAALLLQMHMKKYRTATIASLTMLLMV
jgi:hypothetical protein